MSDFVTLTIPRNAARTLIDAVALLAAAESQDQELPLDEDGHLGSQLETLVANGYPGAAKVYAIYALGASITFQTMTGVTS